MTLEPLPRTSAVDACEASLREAIVDGRFAVGDRLPAERRLAETLGVNRTTLRSALSRLREAGLVTPRQGDGCIVRDYRKEAGPALVGTLLSRADAKAEAARIAGDLFAVRRAVAGVLFERLLTQRPKRRALAALEGAIEAFERAALGGAPHHALAAFDLEVLGAVVDVAGSDVLRLFTNPVARLVRDFERLTRVLYAEPERHLAAHAALLAWLSAPTRTGADAMLAAMAAHDESVVETLARSRSTKTPPLPSSPRKPKPRTRRR